ncbi:hypothetical protein EV175_003947 [Coemansia sp. RSA 1933]|nr:hypothetical protein EV175_003947 [Coemansia sp. RSA 1933]
MYYSTVGDTTAFIQRVSSKRNGLIALAIIITTSVLLYTKLSDIQNSDNNNTDGTLCASIPIPDHYWELTDVQMAPFVEIPQQHLSVGVGHTVCVRVVVPERPTQAALVHTPLPDTPWDSILLDMVGRSTGISVPVHLQRAPRAFHSDTERGGVHIYQADVLLRDVDVFEPFGFLEYRDAQWNFEGGLPLVPYTPEPLAMPYNVSVEVVDRLGSSPFSLARHLELPLCTENSPDGRWVALSDIPWDTSTVLPPDNHNRTWLPYTCRLQRYDYRAFAQCLVDRYPVLHVFGDSNTRRYMKKITLLGSWCEVPQMHAWSLCTCEDFNEPTFTRFNPYDRNSLIDIDPVNGGWPPAANSSSLAAPPGKARIYMRKWDGLTPHNTDLPWTSPLDLGITQIYGSPQAAILSLTNWDVAFTTRAYFASQVQMLLDRIEAAYAPETRIILRTGQYFCCRVDITRTARQYSRMRNKAFDAYLIDQFQIRFGATRSISVWNVASLEEHRPIAVRMADPALCASNHARSELVEIENQILFNHMCNE